MIWRECRKWNKLVLSWWNDWVRWLKAVMGGNDLTRGRVCCEGNMFWAVGYRGKS